MSITTGSGESYDEVLKLADGETFNETNNAGDEIPGTKSLTVGKDYQVQKVKVVLRFGAEEAEQTADADAGPVSTDFASVFNQLSIRDSYADTGSDGELPSGIAYDELTWCQPAGSYQDETNGTGGGWGGYTDVVTFERDIDDIPMWSGSLEEGSTLSMSWQVRGITDGQVQMQATNHLFVTEK